MGDASTIVENPLIADHVLAGTRIPLGCELSMEPMSMWNKEDHKATYGDIRVEIPSKRNSVTSDTIEFNDKVQHLNLAWLAPVDGAPYQEYAEKKWPEISPTFREQILLRNYSAVAAWNMMYIDWLDETAEERGIIKECLCLF